MPGDTEPVFSTNKKHVVFIDVAGIDNLKDITKLRYVHEKGVDAEDVYPGFNDEQVFRIQLYARLIELLTDNGIWVDQGFIKSIIEPDVLEGDMARITQQLKEYQAHRLKKIIQQFIEYCRKLLWAKKDSNNVDWLIFKQCFYILHTHLCNSV